MSDFKKLTDYLEKFRQDGVCLAFSGGVDSALLLKLLTKLEIPVTAVTFSTALHPSCDMEAARITAQECRAPHHVIEIDEFSNPLLLDNPPDRCYHCKYQLFQTLTTFAKQKNLGVIMDGTNADDLTEYRPGLRALAELQVVSPLAACGMSKGQIRALAEELGSSVASRPSSPCMATRLPYGDRITREKMQQIEAGETLLKDAGFPIVRLRVHGGLARIEVPRDRFSDLLAKKEEWSAKLKNLGFQHVTLDLEGFRSGSYDRANGYSNRTEV